MLEYLQSDELGAAAQSAFANLCDKAKLVRNESSRDRTGWDFVVQFPIARHAKASLDQRQSGHTCYVQVKGTKGSAGGRVSMRLSSAELLAKQAGPAFVCTLLLNASGDVLRGYLIHLRGDNLAKLLKRLRQAEADGEHDINHATISYDFKKSGLAFKATPAGLREALATACGDDPAAYVEAKRDELDKLGYDQGRFELKVSFSADRKELLDILLGEKPLVPTKYARFEKRFDISLPIEELAPGSTVELRIQPEPFDTCTVAIRGKPLAPQALFQGRAIGPPPVVPLTEDEARFIIECEDFRLTVSGRRIDFQSNPKLETASRTTAEWRNLFLGISNLADGDGVIVITPSKAPHPVEFPITARIGADLAEHLPALRRTVEDGDRLLGLAGVLGAATVTMDHIIAAADGVGLAAATMLAAEPEIPFAIETMSYPDPSPDRLQLLYASRVFWAGSWLAYSAKIGLAKNEAAWAVEDVTPLDIRPWAAERFDDYVTERYAGQQFNGIVKPTK